MTLSLHEQRILSRIERELSRDPSLRALSTFADPDAEPEPTVPGQGGGGYLITDDGQRRRRPRGSRVMVALGTLLFLLGPAMLVPALLTGMSFLVIPVLVTPLLTVILLVAARRRRDSAA